MPTAAISAAAAVCKMVCLFRCTLAHAINGNNSDSHANFASTKSMRTVTEPAALPQWKLIFHRCVIAVNTTPFMA